MSKIGVDIDGVIADFNSSYIDLLIKVSGEDKFPRRPFDIPCWGYDYHYGYDKKVVSETWRRIKESPTFWSSIPAYRDTKMFLKDLYNMQESTQHDIYFVTSRPGKGAKYQTEWWLSMQGFFLPTVLISDQKAKVCTALQLDYYIDDKQENCQSVHMEGQGKCFMYAQPWNSPIDGVPRISNLGAFVGAVLAG